VHTQAVQAERRDVAQCRQLWYELRKAPCVTCHSDEFNTEYDHDADCDRVHHLSHYTWWACHGGVEAMELEAKKCTPRCAFCHLLQPTHCYYKAEYRTLAEMPLRTVGESSALRKRRSLLTKRAHVDAIKMDIGECQHPQCKRQVTAPTCHAFAFAHNDASTKEEAGVGVCELVHKGPSWKTQGPRILREIARSRLLCANHHQAETSGRNTFAC
jgi:hypothetical protein